MAELLREVALRLLKGQEESFAIRVVANKYDIPDYELALALLEQFGKELK